LNNLLNESKTALKTENNNVDITLSALKDAITKTGETVKTLADVVNALSNVTIGSALPEGTNVVGAVVNKNTDGDEIFTSENPGSMQLTGSNLEVAAVVNVAFAGTRQQLPDKACREVTIIAKRGNTGYIYVGKGDVSSTVFGAELGELDSITLAVSNTNQIYIDASVSGEGISYVAI